MPSIILTIIGPDRPGLVRMLSETVAARGGSWLESRMARLGGQFAGIVVVEAPESLLADLPALEREGLHITANLSPDGGSPNRSAPHADAARDVGLGPRLRLEVVGNDRPGIVHDIARVIAANGVNIEELVTDVASGSFSGEALFRATAELRAPNHPAVEALRLGLEHLGNELMVDIQPLEG